MPIPESRTKEFFCDEPNIFNLDNTPEEYYIEIDEMDDYEYFKENLLNRNLFEISEEILGYYYECFIQYCYENANEDVVDRKIMQIYHTLDLEIEELREIYGSFYEIFSFIFPNN